MVELAELYSRGIKRNLKNYWTAWLPSTRFAIGDIGTLNGCVFEKVGSLDNLGLKYYVVTDNDSCPLDISSDTGVTLSFKAAGETNSTFSHIGDTEAGLKINFSSQGAFIIQAPETFGSEIGDRLNLRRQIARAFNNGMWEKEWVVITRLVKATTATVLISKSGNACLELAAKANLSGTVAALGTANAGLSVKYQRGDTISMIGGHNVTPLFQLSRLKTGFFATPQLKTKSLRANDPSIDELMGLHSGAHRASEDSMVFETLTDDEVLLK